MKELQIGAIPENLDAVLAFIDEELESAGASLKTQTQVDLAVEELFINIACYAYAPRTGDVLLQIGIGEASADAGPVRKFFIVITDSGIPYDPLAKPDPDIKLSAEDRQIGGLGIFLAKKNMDELHYEYKDGHNVLTICKYL